MPNSVVKSVQASGEWNGMFKYEYEMQDGVSFMAFHKEDKPVSIGTEVEYELTKNTQHGQNGKITKRLGSSTSSQNNSGGDDATRNSIEAQVALKEAIQTYHLIGFHPEHQNNAIGSITAYANEYVEWLKTKR